MLFGIPKSSRSPARGSGYSHPETPEESDVEGELCVTGNVGDFLTRSLAECGLGMEPCLELLMHPKISELACVVAVGPTEDISLWSSPALAQRREGAEPCALHWDCPEWVPLPCPKGTTKASSGPGIRTPEGCSWGCSGGKSRDSPAQPPAVMMGGPLLT